MILKHFTDNDLYKFSVMLAIQKLYPWAYVKYAFTNRGGTRNTVPRRICRTDEGRSCIYD